MVNQLLQAGYRLVGGRPDTSDQEPQGSGQPSSERLLRGASVFAAAAAVTGLAGLIFHTLMSRALGPDEYGALAALLNILLVAGVPLAGVELTVAATVGRSADGAAQRVDLSLLLFRSVLVGGLVVALGASASTTVAHLLHLSSPEPVFMAGLYLGLATVAAPLRGIRLGGMRYRRLAGAVLLAGFVKLCLGASLLLFAGRGLTLAMAILVVAELAQVVALGWGSGELWTESIGNGRGRLRLDSATVSTIAMAGIWLLGTGDVIVARSSFVGDAAGVYAAAATAAHTLLFIPQIILQAAFPLLVRSKGSELRRRFWSTTAISLGLSALAGTIMMVVPETVTRVMFGSEFFAAIPLIRTLVPATLAVGVVYAVVHLHLAAGRRVALAAWLGVGGLVAVTIAGTSSPQVLAAWVLAISSGAAVWALIGARRAWDANGYHGMGLRSPATRDLTVVVPFFNPGHQVVGTIDGILDTFADRDVDVEVVAVSDGSSDGSTKMVAELADVHPRVRLIVLPVNEGKGAALRAGMAQAEGEWVGFLDADGDIPPEVLGRFFDLAQLYGPHAVVGCKRHRLSRVIGYPRLRQLLSIGFALLTRLLFRLGVSDTQTGAKVFRRDVLAAALPTTVETGFAFDLELLVAVRAAGFNQLAEAPVTIRRGMSSTVSVSSGLKAVLATARIANRAVTSKQYRPLPAATHEQVSPSLAPVMVGS